MKLSFWNNPVTWLLGLVLLFLIVNLIIRKPAVKEMPNNILVGLSKDHPNDLLGLDSVEVQATNIYQAGSLHRWWLGENNRDAWSAVVKVPILNLKSDMGGLKPVDTGGGKQTMSLELEDTVGIRYTLRTVTKNPSKVGPNWVRTLKLDNILTDGISAAHPYGALILPGMAHAAGLLHTHPRLVFLPVQDMLDTLNESFGGRLYLLEYESEGKNASWLESPCAQEIIDTGDLEDYLEENSENHIDRNAFIRARLFDILIGDWDRHEGQWGWAVCDTGKGKVFTPLAADRDNAFFEINGVFPYFMTQPIIFEKLRSFEMEIKHLPGLLKNGKEIENKLLLGAQKSDFVAEAVLLQKALTDEVIEKSVSAWPSSIYKLSGDEIIMKLISRRDKLDEYAASYYDILSARDPDEGDDDD